MQQLATNSQKCGKGRSGCFSITNIPFGKNMRTMEEVDVFLCCLMAEEKWIEEFSGQCKQQQKKWLETSWLKHLSDW